MVSDRDTPNARDGDCVAIGRCIAGVIRAKDGRGAAQNEIALRERLLPNTTPTIAKLTAQAARRVGEVIAERARG